MTPATEQLTAWFERNAGPLGALAVNAMMWFSGGASQPVGNVTISACVTRSA